MDRITIPEWQKKTLVKIQPAVNVWKENKEDDDIIDVDYIVVEEK